MGPYPIRKVPPRTSPARITSWASIACRRRLAPSFEYSIKTLPAREPNAPSILAPTKNLSEVSKCQVSPGAADRIESRIVSERAGTSSIFVDRTTSPSGEMTWIATIASSLDATLARTASALRTAPIGTPNSATDANGRLAVSAKTKRRSRVRSERIAPYWMVAMATKTTSAKRFTAATVSIMRPTRIAFLQTVLGPRGGFTIFSERLRSVALKSRGLWVMLEIVTLAEQRCACRVFGAAVALVSKHSANERLRF